MPRIHEFESPIRAFVVKIRGRFEPNAAKPQNPAEAGILKHNQIKANFFENPRGFASLR
jgi:hypothetical protein